MQSEDGLSAQVDISSVGTHDTNARALTVERESLRFAPPLPRIQTFIFLLAGCGLLVLCGTFSVAFASFVLLIVSVCGYVAFSRSFERRAEVIERADGELLCASRKTALDHAIAQCQGLEATLAAAVIELERIVERSKVGLAEVGARASSRRAEIEARLTYRLADISNQRTAVSDSLASEVERIRQQAEERALRAGLSEHRLSDADIHGVQGGIKRRLEENGFRTAADFSGFRTEPWYPKSYDGSRTFLIRSDGTKFYIRDVGPERASSIEAWRLRAENAVRQSAAFASAQSEEVARLQGDAARVIAGLDDQSNAARIDAQCDRERVDSNEIAERRAITEQTPRQLAEQEAVIAGFERPIALSSAEAARLKAEWEVVNRGLIRFKRITRRQYLRALVLGA